jgi:large subunit ribosomal protein L35
MPDRSDRTPARWRVRANKTGRQQDQDKMPKMKTKSAAKKRFRLTGTGKVRANVAYKRHMLRNKPQKMKRQARGTFILSDADATIVKRNFLPYGR